MEQNGAQEGFDHVPEAVVSDDGHVLIDAITLREHGGLIGIPDIFDHNTAFLFEMFLPLCGRHLGFLDRSPPIAVAVEGAMTGDGDVLGVECVERGGAALGRDTFEPDVVDIIEVEVVAEDDETVLLCVEADVRFEGDRAGGVETFGDDDRSAAG